MPRDMFLSASFRLVCLGNILYPICWNCATEQKGIENPFEDRREKEKIEF